jgi:tetratricopeptide (TPR) repeat protein
MNAEQQAFVEKIFDDSTSVADLRWKDSFRTQPVLQDIINNKDKITSSLIAAKFGWFFVNFALGEEGRKMTTTNEVYDVIINRCVKYATSAESIENVALQKHATTPESIQHVAFAIGSITYDNPLGRRLFSTPETVSAFNYALQKYATTVESIESVGRAMALICFNNPDGQRLFSTPETVAALKTALQKYATKAESVQSVAIAIASICVSSLSAAVRYICTDNPAGLKLFATNEFISALKNVEKYATTADSKAELNDCLKLLAPVASPSQDSLKIQGNDAFNAKRYDEAIGHYTKAIAVDPNAEACSAIYSNRAACYQALGRFAGALQDAEDCIRVKPSWCKGHYRKGLAYDALGKLDKAVSAFEDALKTDPGNEDVQKCLANTRSRMENYLKQNPQQQNNNNNNQSGAAVASNNNINTSEAVAANVPVQNQQHQNANNNNNNHKMNSLQQTYVKNVLDSSTPVDDRDWNDSLRTQDALQQIINNKSKITSPLIAAKVGWFFASFAETDEGRKMATTNEVYDVIISHCAKHATTTESVQYVGNAIATICYNNSDGQRLFSTPETAFGLNNALEKFATTSESVEKVGLTIATICDDNPVGRRLFSSPETVSAFNNALQKYATSSDSVQSVGYAIAHISANNSDGQRLFSTPETAFGLNNALEKYAKTAESVEHVAIAIANITANNPDGQRLFTTPETVASLNNALQKYAMTAESVANVCLRHRIHHLQQPRRNAPLLHSGNSF